MPRNLPTHLTGNRNFMNHFINFQHRIKMYINKRNKLEKNYFSELGKIQKLQILLNKINLYNLYNNQNEKNRAKRELSNARNAAKEKSKGLKNKLKNIEKEEKQFKQIEQIMKKYMSNYNRNGSENVKVLTTKLRSVFNK